jgi:hypothetical protein
MKELRLGKVLVIISESGRFNWPIHESDRPFDYRRQFITYLPGRTRQELKDLLSNLEFESYQIRKGKRLGSAYEAKVRGLAWDTVRAIAPHIR